METQTMVERLALFSHTKKSKNDKILAVRLEGMFWAGNKVDCSFFMWTLGLAFWRLRPMAIQVERPWEFMAKGLDFGLTLWKLHTMHGRRLQFLYYIDNLFSAHFVGLSTKFDHSIPRPLDLDGHSVKRP
jgi:hypothetical protein